LDSLESFTGSYATTGSNTFIGDQNISGSLNISQSLTVNDIIANSITVENLTVQYITASIIYSSGSNKFGDDVSDVHQFTGSVQVSGSIFGDLTGTASFAINAQDYSASIVSTIENNSASFAADLTSLSASLISVSESFSSSLSEFSASVSNDITDLSSSFSSSLSSTSASFASDLTSFSSSLISVSQSFSSSLSEVSGALSADIVSLSGSVSSDITNLSQSFSSSLSSTSASIAIDISSLSSSLISVSQSFSSSLSEVSSSIVSTIDALSGSISSDITNLSESFSSSLSEVSASIVSDVLLISQSIVVTLNEKLDTSSFNAYTSSNDAKVQSLIDHTGSYATTGSNIFIGNQTISGNFELTGASLFNGDVDVNGNQNIVGDLSITGGLFISGNQEIDGYVKFLVEDQYIDPSISASYIYVSGSTGDLYFTQNSDGFENTIRLRWLEGNLYTGLLSGGIVSGSVGGTTFNVSAGSGIVVSLNATTGSRDPYPVVKYITWNNFTNVTPTFLNTSDTTWLLINANGELVQQTAAPTNGQYDNFIQVGSLIHPNKTTINLYKTFTVTSYALAQQVLEFIRAFGAIKITGHAISPNGANLSINRSSGVSYAIGRNYFRDANKPSYIEDVAATAPQIFKYYKSGSAFVTDASTTTIDPTRYNTPDSGTGLTSAPGGQYTIQRVFYFPTEPNALGVYYGRQTYNSIASALSNISFEPFEENNNTLTQAIFLGYIVVKSGATDLTISGDAQFLQSGQFRSIVASGGGGITAQSLNDLTDVTIASPQVGDVIVYNGAEFQNTKNITSLTGSFMGNLQGTSSFAITSSFALTASYIDGGFYS
jgi:hypothetical protein